MSREYDFVRLRPFGQVKKAALDEMQKLPASSRKPARGYSYGQKTRRSRVAQGRLGQVSKYDETTSQRYCPDPDDAERRGGPKAASTLCEPNPCSGGLMSLGKTLDRANESELPFVFNRSID